MAWIESHQTLRNHPKIVRAARALGISRVTMYGHMHCLWWWAMDYAQDGNISAFDPEDIAEAAEWEGDANVFVAALLESAKIGDKPGLLEMIDGALCIHDWYDYAGKLIDKRVADAERKRLERLRKLEEQRKEQLGTPDGTPGDVRVTSNGHPADVAGTVPNRTLPNPTEPETAASAAVDPELGAAILEFERDISLVSPSIKPDMVDIWLTLQSNGSTDWWHSAIAEAVAANKRSWSYMRAILQTCLQEGHPPGRKRHNGAGHANGNRNHPPVDTTDNEAALRRVLGLKPSEPIPEEV